MLPVFANPAGLWLLLGLPAILAIHFLQQRARVARTSTWFLIEKLAPDSARGRSWDRLRSSRALWLQLTSMLLATWVLAEPRWVRAESTQTVVILFDASASMEAFRTPAIAAAERELRLADGLAARTTWVVLTTNPRQPPLYRGVDRAGASAAFARWQPELGRHDFGPALRLARTLAGAAGRTLLITDARVKVPPDQRAAGVGQPIDNVGFAGATVARESEGLVWRALVKNHATTPQQRTWLVETGGAKSAPQMLQLAVGALSEISARLPEGAERVTVVLSDDGFLADNRLPIFRPQPKPLTIAIEGNDATTEFFRRIAAAVDGAIVNPAAGATRLRLAQASASEVASEPRGGIFWPPADRRAQAPLLAEPITPERDSLVSGLNWQGWFGTGPYGFAAGPGDIALLWQGRWPLVFLRAPTTPPAAAADQPPARKLMLAFDWATSNASRLPATVLLARRFLEAERDTQRSPYAANFDCGGGVPLNGIPLDGAFTMTFEPALASAAEPTATWAIPAAERSGLRAPGRAGFFTVQRGSEIVVRGSAQFADVRQGDFRGAEKFVVEVRGERAAALEHNTTPDPLVVAWLALLAAAVFWSWWNRMSATPVDGGARSPNGPEFQPAVIASTQAGSESRPHLP